MSLTTILRWISSTLGSFDVPSRYSFICGCIFVIWLLLYAIYRIITSEWRSTSSFVLQHLIYPHLFPRIPFLGTATRFEVLVAFLYLLPNVLIVIIGERAEMSSRAATMSIVNLIPLFCGPRLSLVTKLLGVSLRASIGSHEWFGRTAIAQVLLHTLLSVTSSTFTWTTTNLTGVVVFSGSTHEGSPLMFSNRVALPWESSSSFRSAS